MDKHKANHVVTDVTNDIIHEVKVTSYNSVGDEVDSTYIKGSKLQDYVYNCKTRKFIKSSEYYEGKKKKFMNAGISLF
jgi:hypothetical protein